MGFTALHTLVWLLTTLTITMEELARLRVSPTITAECGKEVVLNCNLFSSKNQLHIKRMLWILNNKVLCSVGDLGTNITHYPHTPSDFHCEFENGQLSLIFQSVQPLESGNSNFYMCKLRSNRGLVERNTTIELQECCGTVDVDSTTDHHICTFNQVYPDGEVQWFHSSHKLSDMSQYNTTKQVDKKGWLIIRSYLKKESPDVASSCSLMSTRSSRTIASALLQRSELPVPNGVESHRCLKMVLCISVLLRVTLKL